MSKMVHRGLACGFVRFMAVSSVRRRLKVTSPTTSTGRWRSDFKTLAIESLLSQHRCATNADCRLQNDQHNNNIQ